MKLLCFLGILPSMSEILYVLILLALIMGISNICKDSSLSASGKLMWIVTVLVFNIFGYIAYMFWKKTALKE